MMPRQFIPSPLFLLLLLFLPLKGKSQWSEINPISGTNTISAWSDNRAVASTGSEVYYTFNAGRDWIRSELVISASGSTIFLQSVGFIDSLTVIAAGRITNASSQTSSLILRSVDGGKSFVRVPVGINSSLKVQTFPSDTALAYSGFRIVRSINRGLTWANVPNNLNFSSVLFSSPSVGYGLVETGISANAVTTLYRTSNSGQTWSPVKVWQGFSSARLQVVRGNNVYMNGFQSSGFGFENQFLLSTDGGANFVQTFPAEAGTLQGPFILRRNGVLESYLQPTSTAGQIRIRTSTNFGLTWTPSSLLTTVNGALPSEGSAAATRTYLALNGIAALQHTNNQLEYQASSTNPFGPADIQFLNSRIGFLGGGAGAVLKSTNGGLTWRPKNLNVQGVERIAMVDSIRGYLLTRISFFQGQKEIWKTTNGGESWQNTGFSSLEIPSALVFRDALNGVAPATAGVLFQTTNGGSNWNPVQLPTTFSLLAAAYTPNGRLLCGGDEGLLYRSEDNGQTWNPVALGTQNAITRISFLNANTGFLLAPSNQISNEPQVFRTLDGGLTWLPVSAFTGTGIVNDLVFSPQGYGIGFGQGSDGLREWRYNPQTDLWTSKALSFLNVDNYSRLSYPDSSLAYGLALVGNGNSVRLGKNTTVPQTVTFTVNRDQFCAGNPIRIDFVARGFTDSTQLILQLSDANGNFSNPVVLQTLSFSAGNTVLNGTFNASIPTNTPGGSNYRVRIVCLQPAFESGANGNALRVDAIPQVQAGPDLAFCSSDPAVQFSGFSPAGGKWVGNGVDSTGLFSPQVSGTGIFNLTYLVTAEGCSGSDTRIVRVNPKPVFLVTAVKSTCGQANGRAFVVQSGFQYAWSNGATTREINGLLPGSYRVLVTDPASGCLDSARVLISDSGTIEVSIGNVQASVCRNGAPIALTANPSSGVWSGPGVQGSVFVPSLANPGPVVLLYNLQQSGCSYLRSDTIQVLASPQVSAGSDRSICLNDPPMTLTGLPAGGNWSGACLNNSGQLSFPGQASNCQAVYQFTAANGCQSADTLQIRFNEAPAVPVISLGANGLGVNLPAQGLQFQWFFEGNPVPLATDSNLLATEPGNYTVQVRNAAGCLSVSAPFILTGLAGLAEAGMQVFPNPVSACEVQVVSEVPMEEIRCLNVQGQLVLRENAQKSLQKSLDLHGLPAGIYQLLIQTTSGTKRVRLVVK